jgi:hypothetical protein
MMNKILKDGDNYLIAVEGIKDNKSSETAFLIKPSGEYSTLKNHINMCEDIIYKELNKDIYELNER